MIIGKLKNVEFSIHDKIREEQNKLEAIQNIAKLFEEIDFSAEVLPEGDPERIIKLLVNLKGKPMNETETKVINDVMNS